MLIADQTPNWRQPLELFAGLPPVVAMATTPIAVKLFLALLNFAGMSSAPRVARQPVIFSRAPRYVPNPAQSHPSPPPLERPNASFPCIRHPTKRAPWNRTCSEDLTSYPQNNICLMAERPSELSHDCCELLYKTCQKTYITTHGEQFYCQLR